MSDHWLGNDCVSCRTRHRYGGGDGGDDNEQKRRAIGESPAPFPEAGAVEKPSLPASRA